MTLAKEWIGQMSEKSKLDSWKFFFIATDWLKMMAGVNWRKWNDEMWFESVFYKVLTGTAKGEHIH